MRRQHGNRRDFLQQVTFSSLGLAVAAGGTSAQARTALSASDENPAGLQERKAEGRPSGGKPIKLFCCDLNWTYFDKPTKRTPPAAPHDWAFINPKEYFDWHVNFGVNVMFCQAYTFGGYAFYPTKLGPVAPGPGQELLPKLFELSRSAGLPFWSYFCVGADLIMSNMRDYWVVPTSRNYAGHGFLAPESPWTELLCARVEEFLRLYPVDWILFDWFVYGTLKPDFAVQPAWFVKEPFAQIIGREMPEDASKITPEESLKYKREVLARQFYRIRDTVRKASPQTRISFNVPYFEPAEALWGNHPMLSESDSLFAESSDEVVPWLLSIRKPPQRVMTTVLGRQDGVTDPRTWKKWYERGCDFFAYAWGTPPDFRPHASYAAGLEIIRRAYREMP